MSSVRASVLVPTHDHATTLPLTVGSALRQTVGDLEVIVVGDGVTPDNRAAIEALVAADRRVRFLDFPKGPHHGEVHRHEAIVAARSDAIFYLCDDDLLLRDHVADLLDLLEDANFVQSRNGFIRPDGTIGLHATDLSDPRCIDWHLRPEPRRNATSLTGTAHTRSFYLRAGEHWETTPVGEWPDHHQWKRLFRHPDFRGATSPRMTALQLPTSQDGRDSWSPQQRHAELAWWADLVASPVAQDRVDEMVGRAAQRALADAVVDADDLRLELHGARTALAERDRHIHGLRLRIESQNDRIERLLRRLRRSRRRHRAAEAELASIRASRSWRMTAVLRAWRASMRSGRGQ